MKKKVLGGILAAILIVALAIPAFAAISDSQKKDINNLLSQIAELRKKIVDQNVAGGTITKDQGTQIKKNIDEANKYQEENSGNLTPGLGGGCGGSGGSGYGMMGSYSGSGGMMGGYGAQNNSSSNQTSNWVPGPGQTI